MKEHIHILNPYLIHKAFWLPVIKRVNRLPCDDVKREPSGKYHSIKEINI